MEIDVNKLRQGLSDPERLAAFRKSRVIALGATEEQLARAAWKDNIERIHIPDEVAKTAQKMFDGLVARTLKTHGEGECLVVHAATGAGKTHILNRLLKRQDLASSSDAQGPIRPLLYVRAPSPCNLLTLGRVLYRKLTGVGLPRSYETHEVWEHLKYQLYGQRVSIIVIDEFHHVLMNAAIEKKRTVVSTVKSLVQPEPVTDADADPLVPYPLQVVLAGVDEVNRVIRFDGELSRRTPRLTIKRLHPTTKGLKRMRRFIEAVEEALGFPGNSDLSTDDMVRRFMKATRGYRGRAMHLIKEAAFRAIDDGAARIDRNRHLAAVFRDITGLGPNANPFLVADVDTCPEVKEQIWNRLTLLRGVGTADGAVGPVEPEIDVNGDDDIEGDREVLA